MATRFVITNLRTGNYFTGNIEQNNTPVWTMYPEKVAKSGLFITYPEAETAISKMPTGFYQIDKIFKV